MKGAMRTLAAIISTLIFSANLAHAGHGQFIGNESEAWERCCLSYVRVEAVDGLRPVKIRLRPIARLAGKLDLGNKTVIEAHLPLGPESEIGLAPKPDTHAIAVIFDVPSLVPRYGVYGDPVYFMPGYAGFLPVAGDPTPLMESILKILKDIQDATTAGADVKPIIKAFQKSFEKPADKNREKKP